jgi:hypothetical protein
MTYSKKLKHPKWQKKRLEILKRDKFKCKKCGDEETTLHVHHLEYGSDPWDIENTFLVTLCEDCHKVVESLKDRIEYSDLTIYKSSSWQDGSKIIYAAYKGMCEMTIHDPDGDFICGFNIPDFQAKKIIKIMRKSL